MLALASVVGIAQYVSQQPAHAEAIVKHFFAAGGIPDSVWNHVEVVDDSFWFDVIVKQNVGIGEGYMRGKVKLELLPFFVALLNGTSLGTRWAIQDGFPIFKYIFALTQLPRDLTGYLANMQTRDLSVRVAKTHYDVGNDLYEAMLGPTMAYTCAYWKGAQDLDQAQINKWNLIFRKLESSPGMKVIDIGMGFGTTAKYMRDMGQLDVTGVSNSEEQVKWATAHVAGPGLRFILSDYRDICEDAAHVGTYDRLYTIGFLEAVGHHNLRSFFKCAKALLKPDGLAVVQTIGTVDFEPGVEAFTEKYIFPGGNIPALPSILSGAADLFVLEDFQNIGYDYATTLASWSNNSESFFKQRPKAYSPEFQRMWAYYLRMAQANFELRLLQLWHLVLSPQPVTRNGIARQL